MLFSLPKQFECKPKPTTEPLPAYRLTRSVNPDERRPRHYSSIVRLKSNRTTTQPVKQSTKKQILHPYHKSYHKNTSTSGTAKMLSSVGVSNAIDVSEEIQDSAYSLQDGCRAVASSSSLFIIFLILLFTLFMAIFVALCLGIRVQSLRKKLTHCELYNYTATRRGHHHHPTYYRNSDLQNFSYGKSVDLTYPK